MKARDEMSAAAATHACHGDAARDTASQNTQRDTAIESANVA